MVQEKYGPVGLVHVDAHADTRDGWMGETVSHSTPFRRAGEDGCLQGDRVVQIGLRGSNGALDDYDWSRKQVIRPPTVLLGP